jgi:hypothetical protein
VGHGSWNTPLNCWGWGPCIPLKHQKPQHHIQTTGILSYTEFTQDPCSGNYSHCLAGPLILCHS